MLRCYLLALASGSSVDQLTNNFSVFNLVEQLNVAESALGTEVPIEVHIYWLVSQQARETEIEIRVVRVPLDGGNEDLGGPMNLKPASTDRVRFRAGNFRLPKAYGSYVLAVEWRKKGGDDWHRDPATWPLTMATMPQQSETRP